MMKIRKLKATKYNTKSRNTLTTKDKKEAKEFRNDRKNKHFKWISL